MSKAITSCLLFNNLLVKIDNNLLYIISQKADTAKNIIGAYFNLFKINDPNDKFVLDGNLRLHLLRLERQIKIKRRNLVYDPIGNSDGQLKGPGGLTMNEIFRSVQKSRIIDWDSKIEKLNLHPVHSKVDLADQVTFEIVK